jgi:erythromycin esterase-like protein
MYKYAKIFKNKILRYPRLDTLVMIEEMIRKSKKDFTVTGLWKTKLRSKIMWQTYLTVLDYLVYSGKILIDDKKNIVWIWNSELLARVKKQGVVVR